MTLTRHIIAGFLSAQLVCTVARAELAADNPYAAIVSRNVFGLVPIPTNPPVDPTPVEPPPKITPNGIMTIFGKLQALFNVAQPAKAGQPAHDESYVLTEGEQQDDIEVTKIDEKGGVVTFNNHGVIQELPLVSGQASSGSAPAGGPAGGGNGAPPPGFPGGNRFGRNPNLARGNFGAAATPGGGTQFGGGAQFGGGGQASLGGGGAFGSTGAGANNNIPAEEQGLSPEAQVLLIEKNRLDTQEAVDKGLYPPLPPTPLTPADATAADGSPLIAPSEPVKPSK